MSAVHDGRASGCVTTSDGVRLAYTVDGASSAPPLLFVNSLGTDLGMWAPQAARFGSEFRVIRYDTRGHGRSGTPPGPYTIDRLGMDVVDLLDKLSVERAHLCGMSLGGLTVLWLAARYPERLHAAILANTAARIGTRQGWSDRIEAVRKGGMAAVRETVLERFFSTAFRGSHPEVAEAIEHVLVATDPAGYVAACSALRDAQLGPLLPMVQVPSLIIAGALDEATPPVQSEALHSGIRGSTLVVLDNAAHLSNLEQPEAFSAALLEFVRSTTPVRE